MPQNVVGYGSIPLKSGAKARIAEIAGEFEGWMEWDQFELSEDRLTYAYEAIVTIGKAGDLDGFFEEVASKHAAAGWAHYREDGEVLYYGADERACLEIKISQLEAEAKAMETALIVARNRLAALTSS